MDRRRSSFALMALIVAMFHVEHARADVASIFPRTELDIRLEFEKVDDYPQFDFYLKYGLGRKTAFFCLTKVEARTLIRLEGKGDNLTNVFLIAVPRGQKPDGPSVSVNYANWDSREPVGGLQCLLCTDSGAPVSSSDHQRELTFRISIEDNQLKAECVESKNPTQRKWLAIAGLALSATAIGLVIVIRRRRAARQQTTSPDIL